MPQIAFDPFGGLIGLARHTPVPTLNNYIVVSVAVAVCSAFYAKIAADNEQFGSFIRGANDSFEQSDVALAVFSSSIFSKHFYYSLLHPTFGWIFVNGTCAVLATLAKLAIFVTVGKLSAQESLLLRDRLCNFLIYKAVFLFGVLNTVVNDEVIAWVLWFALLATVASIQSVIVYRLKYLVSTLPSRTSLTRIMALSISLFVLSLGFVLFAFKAFSIFSLNITLFILVDAIKTLLRNVYMLIKCGLLFEEIYKHLSSLSLTTFTYYLEFINDITVDIVDLFHHSHMLIYSQVMLSMACIVISIQLRSYYKSFVSRIERHRKYKRICSYINSHYPEASQVEIANFDEWCAICWEGLENARKLPCNHLFHEWCLRRWLEQDSSCPTCRIALPSPNNVFANDQQAPAPLIRPFNHVFRFNGAQYARWLPSFSVEFSHNVGPNLFQANRRPDLDHSQLNTLALQVHDMFPQLDMTAIADDLRETGSLQATIDNILEGRFQNHDPTLELENEIWSGTDTSSISDNSSEGPSTDNAEDDDVQEETSLPCAQPSYSSFTQKKTALIAYNRKQYLLSTRARDLRLSSGAEEHQEQTRRAGTDKS